MQITEESKDLKSKPTHTAIIAPTSLTQLDTTTAVREGLEVPMPDLEEQVESGCLCCQSKGRAATDRLHFVRKVYLLLLMQVFLTAVWLVLVLVIAPLRNFIIALWPLALCMFGASLLSLLVLLCIPRLHRRVPWNYILLLLFTLSGAYTLSWLSAFFQPETVLAAGLITCVMFISLTLYVWLTPKDFQKWLALPSAFLGALLGFGLVFAFMSTRPFHALICLLLVGLYSLYLVLDTEAVLGRTGRGAMLYDDYILGTLCIYKVRTRQDLVLIMVFLMSLFGGAKSD